MRHIIIGLGNIGARHYRNLRSLTDDEILTVDPDPQRDADIVDSTIPCMQSEIIYICSPTPVHYEWIDRAIAQEARAIFVEKPLVSAGRFLRFDSNIPIVVGYQYRFHPVFQHIKQFGTLLRYLYMYANENIADIYGKTALETMASHSIDIALWCAGPAKKWQVHDCGEDATIQIWHKNGCATQIYANIILDPRVSDCRFIIENGAGGFGIERHDPMYIDEMKAWLNFLNTGDYGDLCTYEQALMVQEIMAKKHAKINSDLD